MQDFPEVLFRLCIKCPGSFFQYEIKRVGKTLDSQSVFNDMGQIMCLVDGYYYNFFVFFARNIEKHF